MNEKIKKIIGPAVLAAMIGSAVAVGRTFGRVPGEAGAGVAFGILFFIVEIFITMIVVEAVSAPSPAQKVAQFVGRWKVLRVESVGGQVQVLIQDGNGRKLFAAWRETLLGRRAELLNFGDRIEIRPREPGVGEYCGYLENYLELSPAS